MLEIDIIPTLQIEVNRAEKMLFLHWLKLEYKTTSRSRRRPKIYVKMFAPVIFFIKLPLCLTVCDKNDIFNSES